MLSFREPGKPSERMKPNCIKPIDFVTIEQIFSKTWMQAGRRLRHDKRFRLSAVFKIVREFCTYCS